MRTLSLIALSSLILACQPPTRATTDDDQASEPARPAEPEPGPGPEPGQAKDACTVAALKAELASFCDFDLGVPPLALAKVSWTAPPYHPLATRVISLDAGGLTDPEGAKTVSIQEWLADPPRRIPEPGELVFAIAGDLPATTVAELLRGLAEAGREEIRVLVHVGGDPVPTPRNPAMLANMREALPSNPNERVMFVAKAVQGYGETCPPVAGVFPQLAQVASGDRCIKLGELASAAIVECGCVDLDEIMTLLYALTIGFDVPPARTAAVPVALDPKAAVTPAKGATWAEIASQQLTSTDLHPLWLL